MNKQRSSAVGRPNRREFLRNTTLAAGALLAAPLLGQTPGIRTSKTQAAARPNFLFLHVDQLACEAIAAHGCAAVKTPNLDRIAQRGISFQQSYSANPVCCPARSSWMTGRLSPETGVMINEVPIVKSLPDLGQWLRPAGYDVFHTGKWHVPGRSVRQSFNVLGGDQRNNAQSGDIVVARTVEGFLRNYDGRKPFLVSAGLLDPHDICNFPMIYSLFKGKLPYPELLKEFPALPSNFEVSFKEPKYLVQHKRGTNGGESTSGWTPEMWQFYLWSYYRYVEITDGLVGIILCALEQSRFAKNTVLILAADHGDGHARHKLILKSYLYDEAARVPFMMSLPGAIPAGVMDRNTLVSGVDLFPTICDYAGLDCPPKMRGVSLRSVAEGGARPTRDFIVAHSDIPGRMIRTSDYKLISYHDDPVVQLFDMKNDPLETRNLAEASSHAATTRALLKQLDDYEARLDKAPLPAKRGSGTDI